MRLRNRHGGEQQRHRGRRRPCFTLVEPRADAAAHWTVEATPCGEEVVLPDFGRRAHLPQNQTVSVEVTPPKPGEYEFTCGMNMYRGKVVVESR